jgi:hypothetical protein
MAVPVIALDKKRTYLDTFVFTNTLDYFVENNYLVVGDNIRPV